MFATRFLCSMVLGVVVFAPGSVAADESAIQALLHKDGLGGLRLEQSERTVIKLLGKPEKEGKPVKQEADGSYVQKWDYPSKGLALLMSSGARKDGPRAVAAITARPPCTLATQR